VSDAEGFLTRWSRRKREAEHAESDEVPATDAPNAPNAPAAPAESNEASAPPASSPPAADEEEPAVDLASLPSIESITAGTDIRAFLAPGVPLHLTHAALRRAWVADPAIRDFVGLAENAWDFTAPDAIPGFGSLVPQEAQRLLAELMRQDARVSSSEHRGEPLQKPEVSAQAETPAPAAVVKEAPVADATSHDVVEQNETDAALQKEEATDDRPMRLAGRHGGAIPH